MSKPETFTVSKAAAASADDNGTVEKGALMPNGHHLLIFRRGVEVTLIDAQDNRWENAFRQLRGAIPAANSSSDVQSH